MFQVKKSSHSKKVMRMMDKERKKKKSKGGSGGGGSIPDDNELKSGQLDSGSSSSLISKPNTQGKNCSESSTHSVKKDRTESSKQKIQTEIRSSDDFVVRLLLSISYTNSKPILSPLCRHDTPAPQRG